MAKIKPYTQRYSTSTPKATAEEFGAATGRALQQAGQFGMDITRQMQDVELRRVTRADTIERVRGVRDFNQIVQQEATRMESEDDMSSTDAPGKYNTFIKESIAKAVSNHTGSEDSRARLEEQLTLAGTQYSQNAYKLSVTAQYQVIKDEIGQQTRVYADMAGDVPAKINDIFTDIDKTIDDLASAMPKEAEMAYRNSMKSAAIKSAASAYISSGDFDAADLLISGNNVATILDQDTHRQLKTQIIVGKRKVEKAEQTLTQKRAEMVTLLGRPLTEAENLRLMDIAPPASGTNVMTLSEKLKAFETAVGRPATEAEIQKIYGVHIAEEKSNGGTFGTSLKGRSLDIMNDTAVGFANGALTQEQEQTFMTAVIEYTQPIQFQNPDTKLWETRRNKLPPHVQEALDRRGIQIQPTEAKQGEVINVEEPLSTDAPTDPAKTIWGRRGNIAGVVPAVARAVGQTPLIGELFEGGGEFTIDKQYAKGLQKNLVKILQNNPRYAEGERQAIEKEISILSSAWDNVTAYEKRLIGLDESLEKRENQAFKTAQSKMVSSEERKHAMNVLNGIRMFREHLGVPIRVKTVDEAKALPPGTPFISPSGKLMFNNIVAPVVDEESDITIPLDEEMSGVQ